MVLLTGVSAKFGDVACPVCGAAFAVTGIQARAANSPGDRQWLQDALQEEHGAHKGKAVSNCHAPSFPLFGPPLPVRRRRLFGVLPAVAVPYSPGAALRYNG